MNLFYYPYGNSWENFDLASVRERCTLYGGSWDRWQWLMPNPIDNALAEIIHMNRAEEPSRIVQSLWKAKPKAICGRCGEWMHIEVRPLKPPFAQTYEVCDRCKTSRAVHNPFQSVDYREWIDYSKRRHMEEL